MHKFTLKSRLMAICMLPLIILAVVVVSVSIYVTSSVVFTFSNKDMLNLSQEHAGNVRNWFEKYQMRCITAKNWFERNNMSNEQIFHSLQIIYDMWDGKSNMHFSTVDGNVFYGSGDKYESSMAVPNIRLRYMEGLGRDQIKFFPPHTDFATSATVITFQVPVFHPDNSLRGVLTDTIRLDELKDYKPRGLRR